MNIDLNTPSINVEPISVVDYPSAGTGETVGCDTAAQIQISKAIALTAQTSSSGSSPNAFSRVNSFSTCKMPDNSAIIAVASQDVGVENLPPTTDAQELARRAASRVNLISTPLGNNYAACTHRAVVTGLVEDPTADCPQGVVTITIDVGTDVWGDTKLNSIWALDGTVAGIKFRIVSRTSPNIWNVVAADQTLDINLVVGTCFRFVAYASGIKPTYPNSLNFLSPLPYIVVDDFAVPAVNPQVATNACAAPNQPPYVYVIAEAPVDGAYQLFFYGLKVGPGDTYEMFGWRQLTFDGENRNARVKCDTYGNLHVVWESSRCQPSQVYYGVIGPSSRAIANEVMVAAVDKQISEEESSIPSLVSMDDPTSIDLRDVDEYGVTTQSTAWSTLTANSGSATINTEHSLTVSGNPRTQKFAGFASLKRDQDNFYFDGMFSQLSYQVTFDLNLSAATNNWDQGDIDEEFVIFKQGFTTSTLSTDNFNLYVKNGKTYTIDDPKIVYDNIIPLQGAYKNDGASQIALRHYMLVAVPEKLRLVAKSTQGFADITQESYTGRFKLGLVFETSANISDHTLAYQKHHWVRLFGDPLNFNEVNNYAIAIHYSHLREEGVWDRADNDTIEGKEQDVRFAGDIIVVVNDKAAVAESFIPDFSDIYHQFDLGFGCATVGEFRTITLNPYDGSVNADLAVGMDFTNIVVGPHSVKVNDYLTAFAKSDRNTERMVILSDATELDSLTAGEEAWETNAQYRTSLGLDRQKFGLSQVPITSVGKNIAPCIALDRCGRPHVAYQSNRDTMWEIYYGSGLEAGMPFRFDTRITDSESDSLCPTIAVDNEGRRLISWHDNRNGVYQIYAARSTAPINCNEGICTRDWLAEFGLDPVATGFQIVTEYDPYINDPYYASISELTFIFRNDGLTTKKFHFIADFFTDPKFTSFYKAVDSRFDISHWFVDGAKMPFDGVSVAPGQAVEVVYYPSKEDNISGEVYYVEVSADDGTQITPLETTLLYFSPVQQSPKCHVPVVFTNPTLTTQNVNFSVTIYRDEEMTEPVLVAQSQDVIRWSAGAGAFPSGGISVNSGDTVSVTYNPEFTDLAQSEDRSAMTINSLLCGVTYYVSISAFYNSAYHPIDTFSIKCACSDIKTQIWRKDTQSFGWHCSGQGGQDVRVTATGSHALFPTSDASEDGVVYIVWEDRRFAQTQDNNNHYIYWGIWDARTDEFYSSAQGFRDREVSTFSRFRPSVIVNNMQHATFVFSEGRSLYTRTCSLYQTPMAASSSSSAGYLGDRGVFNQTPLPQSVANCLSARVYEDDVVDFYHKDAISPIALIDACKIRLEIVGPPGTYAVRFRNEDETGWSEWLNILPRLQDYPSSSSSGLRGYLDGYFIANDRFVVPWILSRGSGNKTVTCQVLTYSGISPEFSVNIVARYRELKHRIEFFRDASYSIQASMFNGTPVVSTKALTVDATDVTSIGDPVLSNSTIYVKVTFDDGKRLDDLLQITSLSKYGGIKGLTFDVYTQGFNRFDLPLTQASSGVYTGSFTIGTEDGIDNKDGQAVVLVNIPAPCAKLRSSSSATCLTNITKPSDIQLLRQADVENAAVNLEKFRIKYGDSCLFTANQCVDGTEDFTEDDDDTILHQPTSGPVGCQKIDWISPRKGELGFYLANGGQNEVDWIVQSPVFELDFSDSRIDYLKIDDINSQLDDVLILMRATDTIVFSTSPSGSSSSSGTVGGVPNPLQVTFTIPQGAILFAANKGYYCHKQSNCNNGSAAKAFFVSTTKIGQIPAGTPSNDGTGTILTAFTASLVPWALGFNDGSLTSSSSATLTNVLKTTFSTGVSKNELNYRGYITANGKLRFRLVHIPSGVGHAYVYGITCGAACDMSSSSSSS